MTKKLNEKHLEAARAAAVAQASEHAVGELLGHSTDDSLTTFVFTSKLKGYVGWNWSVSVYQGAKGDEPTISEVLLLPGDQALLAPNWVPWSERLADYKALQAELEAQAALDALEAENAEGDEDAETETDEDDDVDGFDEVDDDETDEESDADEDDEEEVDEADDLPAANPKKRKKA